MAIIDVTVIAAQGAILRGPVTIRLTPEQHGPRHAVLGKWVEGGVYALDGGVGLSFKRGEVLGIEQPAGRLNPALFAWDEPETEPEPEPEPEPRRGRKARADDDAGGDE